jgi:hypothetical protein
VGLNGGFPLNRVYSSHPSTDRSNLRVRVAGLPSVEGCRRRSGATAQFSDRQADAISLGLDDSRSGNGVHVADIDNAWPARNSLDALWRARYMPAMKTLLAIELIFLAGAAVAMAWAAAL